jgi:hypothetical protein
LSVGPVNGGKVDRRDFLSAGLNLGAVLAVDGALAADSAGGNVVTLSIRADEPFATIAPDFMGLGYEISSVTRPGLMQAGNGVLVQLIRTLGAQGIIRIGGNTSDYAHYAPTDPPVSSAFGTVVNDAALEDLGGFLEATGWKLIWGLDLGRGSVTEAIAEASRVMSAAKQRLLAFEIGNEPDLFGRAKHRQPEYGYEDWLAEYRRYKAALRARFPRIPLAGPDAAGATDWVTRFAADEGGDAVLLTHHYYREHQNPDSTIAKLLAPDPKLQPQLEQLQAAASRSGVPYRICEVNSFSGGGRPGVSDTMAGALWALDYLYTLASHGCSGVNIETGVNHLDFVSSYSPIGEAGGGHFPVKPEYYGMLAFALGGKGKMMRAAIQPGSDALRAYATRSGQAALVLTLINKDAVAVAVDVMLSGFSHSPPVAIVRLTAPAVDATDGIRLGGTEVTPEGHWRPSSTETVAVSAGRLRVSLPGYSAAVCTMQSDYVTP